MSRDTDPVCQVVLLPDQSHWSQFICPRQGLPVTGVTPCCNWDVQPGNQPQSLAFIAAASWDTGTPSRL